MERACTPEKYTNICQTTWRHDPEYIDLTSQTINPKSHFPLWCCSSITKPVWHQLARIGTCFDLQNGSGICMNSITCRDSSKSLIGTMGFILYNFNGMTRRTYSCTCLNNRHKNQQNAPTFSGNTFFWTYMCFYLWNYVATEIYYRKSTHSFLET